MEDILSLILFLAVLIFAGYLAKTTLWDMRKQRSLNADFLKRRGFNEALEEKEHIKELIIARDARIALEELTDAIHRMFKIVDCYKTTENGKEIFFLTVSGFAQPESLIESVYILAPLEKRKKDPFYVRLWSNTYGPGSSVYKSKKRTKALDFGKTAKMNGREIFRSDDLPDFEHVDFYGPTKERPENYLGSVLLEMLRKCRANGIAEISCVDGLALFRIYSLTGTKKFGNILTDPERPYQYLLNYM
ncbi:MAG: hypothetical protein OQL16_05350 [Gammaproteobacteria bacterium]|nr:hypothetical protein [Gammaproteobacteria bacterium]